jgi:hypothetical protein
MKILSDLIERLTGTRPPEFPPALFDAPVGHSAASGATRAERAAREAGALTRMDDLAGAIAHYDGYWREAALNRAVELGRPELVPSIVDRLNDWVESIRDAARAALLALLPVTPPAHLVALLPRIDALRRARRWDHTVWLQKFEGEMIKVVPVADWIAGARSGERLVARACYNMLQRHALVAPNVLADIGLNPGNDILMASGALAAVAALPPEAQQAFYLHASQSHFGGIRGAAVRALLIDAGDERQQALARRLLLDLQTNTREAAAGFLLRAQFDVGSFYRAVLANDAAPVAHLRAALAGLAAIRQRGDVPLLRQFTQHGLAALRLAAYAGWVRVSAEEKDAIALQSMADASPSVRKLAVALVRRTGAYVPFVSVCDALMGHQDYLRLLKYSEMEKWKELEAIALVASAFPPGDQLRAELRNRMQAWIGSSGSFTRPTPEQVTLFSSPQTIGLLATLAPPGFGLQRHLSDELAIAIGRRG